MSLTAPCIPHLVDQRHEILDRQRFEPIVLHQCQHLVPDRQNVDQRVIVHFFDGPALTEFADFTLVPRPALGGPVACVPDELDHVQGQNLYAEPLEQFTFVHDRGPEEIDPLSNVPDADSVPEHVRHVDGPEEPVHSVSKDRFVDPAVFDVTETHSQFVQDLAGGEKTAQCVP